MPTNKPESSKRNNDDEELRRNPDGVAGIDLDESAAGAEVTEDATEVGLEVRGDVAPPAAVNYGVLHFLSKRAPTVARQLGVGTDSAESENPPASDAATGNLSARITVSDGSPDPPRPGAYSAARGTDYERVASARFRPGNYPEEEKAEEENENEQVRRNVSHQQAADTYNVTTNATRDPSSQDELLLQASLVEEPSLVRAEQVVVTIEPENNEPPVHSDLIQSNIIFDPKFNPDVKTYFTPTEEGQSRGDNDGAATCRSLIRRHYLTAIVVMTIISIIGGSIALGIIASNRRKLYPYCTWGGKPYKDVDSFPATYEYNFNAKDLGLFYDTESPSSFTSAVGLVEAHPLRGTLPRWRVLQLMALGTLSYSSSSSSFTGDHWLDTCMNECSWSYYNECQDGRLTRLEPEKNVKLSGVIPSGIFVLSSLTSLRLRDGNLGGTLPSELGLLTNLTELDLSYNQLSGTIPTEIGLMTALTRLDLKRNQLTGSLPTEILSMTALTGLYLLGNTLTIPTEIGLMTSLATLDFGGYALSGTIPTEIGLMTALIGLYLWGNTLTGPILTEIGLMTSLATLAFGGNALTGTIPTEIGLMTALYYLSLWANQLTGSLPTAIGLMTALTGLSLWSNQLTGPIPTEIGLMTALYDLSLWANQLTGSLPTAIGLMTALTRLDLKRNQLTGSLPTEIGLMTALTGLYLHGNTLTGGDSIRSHLCC